MLGGDGFFCINKQIVKDIGIDSAIMFSILCDGESICGEEFYQTREMILSLSFNYIKKTRYENCVKALEGVGFISTEIKKGLPPRRYFKINTDKVMSELNIEGDDTVSKIMMKDLIGQNAFFMLNKRLVKELGWESAMFMSILADAEKIFADDDVNAGFVFQTQPTVEAMSMGVLTRRKQETAVKALVEAGIIEQKNMGLPMRRYFRINNKALIELFKRED
ncbi:MAG: hypothetical protein ACRCX2_16335 [Paraclostridium sp.]